MPRMKTSSLIKEPDTKHQTKEQILAKLLQKIKEHTYESSMWQENTFMESFLDDAASVTMRGKPRHVRLAKYLDNKMRSSTIAGGVCSNKAGTFCKSTQKLKLNVIKNAFIVSTGKKRKEKTWITEWYLSCITG